MKKSSQWALFVLCLIVMAAGPLMAKGADEQPAAEESDSSSMTDLETMIEIPGGASYVLPRPIVFFTVVEKIGEDYDFSTGVSLNSEWNYESYIKLALNLGARSADGMAFYATGEKTEFRENAETIEKMVGILGIEDDIRAPLDEMKKALAAGDEQKIQELADNVYTSVEKVLQEQDKQQLAQFISLGSWVEGAYIVSTALVEDYDEKVSRVVALPSVVRTYINVLEDQEELVAYEPVLQEVKAALEAISPLIDVDTDAPVPLENIQKIQSIVSDLKTAIEAN